MIIAHNTIIWIFVATTIGLSLAVITAEKVEKVFRAVLTVFGVVIITPIVDLAISGGKGKTLAYFHPKSWHDFFPWPHGFSPGMVCTSFTGIFLIFGYTYLKTKNPGKGLLGTLAGYSFLLLASLLPDIFHIKHPLGILRLTAALLLICALATFYLYRKNSFIALWRDMRVPRLSYYLAMFILGMTLVKTSLVATILGHSGAFILTIIVIALCWYSSIIFNNIEDLSIDQVSNRCRPLVCGVVTPSAYAKIGIGMTLAAVIFGLLVNFSTAFFALLGIGACAFYSLPPLKLKRIPVLSKLCSSFNSLALVMLGFVFAGGDIFDFPIKVTWYFLIFVTIAFNFIDIKDYEGDKQNGIKTLPAIMGLKTAKTILGGACFLAYALAARAFSAPEIMPLALFFGMVQFYLINKKNYSDRAVLTWHLTAIVCLIIFLALNPVPVKQNPITF